MAHGTCKVNHEYRDYSGEHLDKDGDGYSCDNKKVPSFASEIYRDGDWTVVWGYGRGIWSGYAEHAKQPVPGASDFRIAEIEYLQFKR